MAHLDREAMLQQIAALEQYLPAEIDKDNHSGFLSVCRALGVTDKQHTRTDSELAGVFSALQPVLHRLGINTGHDFAHLQAECQERERWAALEQENDQMEIQFARSKEQLARLYIKKAQLKEAGREKERLEQQVALLTEKSRLSQVSAEVLELAASLQLSSGDSQAGQAVDAVNAPAEYSEEFYGVFLPFVNLSIDAVNFLYNQITVVPDSGPANKQLLVEKYIKYIKDADRLSSQINRAPTRQEKLGYELVRLSLDATQLSVEELCRRLGLPREEVIERVFFLCAKGVFVFDRASDTIGRAK